MNALQTTLANIYNFGNYKNKPLQEFIIDHLTNYYIFWKDKNSVFLGCNQAFASIFGFTSTKQIIGKTDHDLPCTKSEIDSYINDDQYVMESRKPKLHIEESLTLANGQKIILSTSKFPLINEKGEVFGILGIYCDITEQKNAQQELHATNLKLEQAYQDIERFRDSLIDYLPNYYIFWKDKQSTYLGCNLPFVRLADQKNLEDIIGKTDYDYWPKQEADAYRKDDQEVMNTGKPKFNIEEEQTTPWGEKIILSTSKVPLRNGKGEIYGVLGIFCDVTQQRKIEENTRITNLKLEQEYQFLIETIHSNAFNISKEINIIEKSIELINKNENSIKIRKSIENLKNLISEINAAIK